MKIAIGTTFIKRLLPAVIVAVFAFFIALLAVTGIHWAAFKQTPEQPIAFSHKIHISRVGLECTHCHQYVERSPRAGIPPLATCMECHRAVATDRPEIQKLTGYWEREQPVPWNRVYTMRKRKYVYFTHKRHIKAGVECINCHGDVGQMDVMRKVKSLEMGWCITCHRSRGAPVDCYTCHK